VPSLPSGTVTFLFTDIEGSTRLLKLLGSRYGDVLSEHQRLLRTAVAEAYGQEIETQGDSFFVAFRRGKDAVLAAVGGQRAIAAHSWPDGVRVAVRMGIHTGEPTVGPDRYVGLGVHRAARICAAGHGGQVLLSNTTRDLVEDELPADVAVRDLGEHHLKDIDRPERLFQLEIPGLQNDFPPLKSEPAQATLFAGREGELEQAAEAAVEPRDRPRRRTLFLAALAGVLAAAVSIPIFALGRGQPGSDGIAEPGGSPASDIAGVVVGKPIPVGRLPLAITFGAGAVWVANGEDGTVTRIDPDRNAVVGSAIPVGLAPTGIAVGDGVVWVANSNDGTVSRIDANTNEVIGAPIQVGKRGQFVSDLAVGEDTVWVVRFTIPEARDTEIVPIDARSGNVLEPAIRVPGGGSGKLAFGHGEIWFASEGSSNVTRVDPVLRKARGKPIRVGRGPQDIAVGEDAVWVVNLEGTITRIDATTKQVVGLPIPVGRKPMNIAVGEGGVWVVNAESLTIDRIDPNTNQVVGPLLRFGKHAAGEGAYVAVGAGAVWVANAGEDNVTRIEPRSP
jgi:class 3 adenylate cyclase/DNA-binding beta-propeller fold protein YncE